MSNCIYKIDNVYKMDIMHDCNVKSFHIESADQYVSHIWDFFECRLVICLSMKILVNARKAVLHNRY